jgi:hypothetical protein
VRQHLARGTVIVIVMMRVRIRMGSFSGICTGRRGRCDGYVIVFGVLDLLMKVLRGAGRPAGHYRQQEKFDRAEKHGVQTKASAC